MISCATGVYILVVYGPNEPVWIPRCARLGQFAMCISNNGWVVSASRSNYVLRFQQKLFGVPPVLGTAITMPTPSLFVS